MAKWSRASCALQEAGLLTTIPHTGTRHTRTGTRTQAHRHRHPPSPTVSGECVRLPVADFRVVHECGYHTASAAFPSLQQSSQQASHHSSLPSPLLPPCSGPLPHAGGLSPAMTSLTCTHYKIAATVTTATDTSSNLHRGSFPMNTTLHDDPTAITKLYTATKGLCGGVGTVVPGSTDDHCCPVMVHPTLYVQ